MLSLQNKGIEERNQRDLEELEKVARKLEAGQVALERKALLYEKYQRGEFKIEDLEDDRLLVDFEKKEWEGAVHKATDDEEDHHEHPEKVRGFISLQALGGPVRGGNLSNPSPNSFSVEGCGPGERRVDFICGRVWTDEGGT